MRHTFEAHSTEPFFMLICGIDGCTSSFTTLSGISSHLSRKHLTASEPTDDSDNPCRFSTPPAASVSVMEYSEHEDSLPCSDSNSFGDPDIDMDCDNFPLTPCGGARRSAALFLLTLKERFRATQTTVDFAVSQVNCIAKHIVEDIHSTVWSKLEEHFEDANSSLIPDLTDCFLVSDPFNGLDTHHKQDKFYKEHFKLVVS